MSANTWQRDRSIATFVARLPDHGCGLLDCWPMRTTRSDGYATFGDRSAGLVQGEKYAHRIVATLVFGRIPKGFEVDHRCFTRNCVNPFHLRICTLATNRKAHQPRPPKSHCPSGHLYAEVGRTSQGRCRACQQEDMRLYHAANREAINSKRAERRRLTPVAS